MSSRLFLFSAASRVCEPVHKGKTINRTTSRMDARLPLASVVQLKLVLEIIILCLTKECEGCVICNKVTLPYHSAIVFFSLHKIGRMTNSMDTRLPLASGVSSVALTSFGNHL